MNLILKRILFIICIMINCVIIFQFSGQVAEESGTTSRGITKMMIDILPEIKDKSEEEKNEIIEKIQPTIRKVAHFSIYTLLGILVMAFMHTFKGRSFYQKGLTAFLFCFIYAFSDEFHQWFIPGRSSEFRDVCIDSLGALTGILFVWGSIKLYRKVTNKMPIKVKLEKKSKIMFISSTGGHFDELMQLKSVMQECNYHIVTEKTKSNCNLKEKYNKKINFLLYETKRRPLKYAFVLFVNCFISLAIYLKVRPQVVITTGTHTAGPMCCIAKILGSKVIYIETFANRKTKTEAGKLLYYVADTFIVQWEEMLELYPKAKFIGWIY